MKTYITKGLIAIIVSICCLVNISQTNIIAGEISTITAEKPEISNLPVSANEDDSLALVTLFNDCNGLGWVNQDNWLTGPVETWHGILLDGSGRVIEVLLGDNGLQGVIPGAIGQLTELIVLSLNNNGLNGELTSSMSNLINLTDINLGYNDLGGDLPDWISSLTSLTNLQLGFNQFTGGLPSSWVALTQLQYLGLRSNQLGGIMPGWLSNLTNLKELSLWTNNFEGEIPSSLAALTNLESLSLSSNQLEGPLPEWISGLTSLLTIGLGSNNFTGEIPSSWSSLTSLTGLYLYENLLTGAVPDWLTLCPELTSFYTFGNSFTEFPDLSGLTNLSRLSIHTNLLEFDDIEPNMGIASDVFDYSPQSTTIGAYEEIILNPGEEFSTSVVIGGANNLYQWMKNDVPIPGANSASFTIGAIAPGDEGSYSCLITNSVVADLSFTSEPVQLSFPNGDTNINAFDFDYTDCGCDVGTWIDQDLGRILVRVPNTLDISNLAPSNVETPPGSVIVPDKLSIQDWTNGPIEYTITSSDEQNQQVWSVVVENPPCSDTDFRSWEFVGVQLADANFYPEESRIDIDIQHDADISQLEAQFEVKCGAWLEFDGIEQSPGFLMDFSTTNEHLVTVHSQNPDISQEWFIRIFIQDVTPPVIRMDQQQAMNCDDHVMMESNEIGRLILLHESQISEGMPTPDLSDYSVHDELVGGELASYVDVIEDWIDDPVQVPTHNIYAGTYYGFSVDNYGNVSDISTNTVEVEQCTIELPACDLKNVVFTWKYHITEPLIITYEETRPDGNIKFAQSGDCGIMIKDNNETLPEFYGVGTIIENLLGEKDGAELHATLIPDAGTSPTIISTGNPVDPIELSYEEFFGCYFNRDFECMLVKITTPIIPIDVDGGNPNWVYDDLQLLTPNAIGNNDYFIQKSFNADYIGTPIPTEPMLYTGIRVNSDFNGSSDHIYGLLTPRSFDDIAVPDSPNIVFDQSDLQINCVFSGACNQGAFRLVNEGVGPALVSGFEIEPTGDPGFEIINAPTFPLILDTWESIVVTIQYCPVNPDENNTIFRFTGDFIRELPLIGTTTPIFDMDWCDDFGSWPHGEYVHNGWTGTIPANLSIYITDHQGFGGTPDESVALFLRNRHMVNEERIPIHINTPGITITGENPVISWEEMAYAEFNDSGTNSSPRNLYISTDGISWTLVDSYLTSSMPDPSVNPDDWFRTQSYSLTNYIGQTISWKFEAISNNNEYIYWVIDNVCIKEVYTTPVFAIEPEDGHFRQTLSGETETIGFRIWNEGVSQYPVSNIYVDGDPAFSIDHGYGLPFDIMSPEATFSENGDLEMLFDVHFNPSTGGEHFGSLFIEYDIDGPQVREIPLFGIGVSCDQALPAVIGENLAPGQNSWFTFTADNAMLLYITSCDERNTVEPYSYSYDSFLSVYDDCEGNLLAESDDIEWEECPHNRASSAVTLILGQGQTIKILWPWKWDSPHGEESFFFHLEADYLPDGDICENAIPLTLPVVDLQGTTEGFHDFYESTPCSDQNYMDGNDVVYTLELDDPGTLVGIIDGSYTSINLLNECPDHELARENCIAFASGSSGGSFEQYIEPGFYYIVISTWAPPQAADYTLNLFLKPENQNTPDWNINPSHFEQDGEITAEVFIDDVPEMGGDGILGAFVGDELRGVKQGGIIGLDGKYVFIMRVFSNEPAGDIMNFRYYDPDLDLLLDVVETYPFEADMTLGDAIIPIPLNCYTSVQLTRSLTSGWNWISLNVESPDMSVGTILNNLPHSDGDYIKNQTVSATYYNDFGWFGALADLHVLETYKIKLNLPGDIKYDGMPADPAERPIPVKTGWNWIGFPVQEPIPIAEALATLNPIGNDYVKNQTVSATFYTDFGWFGEMAEMIPLDGYMLKSGKEETITYPGSPIVPLVAKTRLDEVPGSGLPRQVGISASLRRVSGFDPADFEYSGQVNAEVFLNGQVSGNVDDILLTFSEGRMVGQSSPMIFPPTGLPVFNHLAFENSENDRKLEFYYYDSEDNQWYKFEETLSFNADMIEADAFEPFRLEKASMINDPTSDIRHLTSLKVFPNPASNLININLELPNDQNVTLQILDPLGRVVDEIQAGKLPEGSHQLTHDVRSLKQGYYLIRMKDQIEISKRLIITH